MKSRVETINTTKQKATLVLLSVLLVALAVILSGCRAEEQGRVLQYKAGTYQGKQDAKLDATQLRMLSDRIVMQSDFTAKSGGAPSRSPDVSLPKSSKTMDWQALGDRLEGQKAEPVKKAR